MDNTLVKSKIINYFKSMDQDKILEILFQVLIFSSFWGLILPVVTVPGIGELFLFRIAIVIFICYYLNVCIKEKKNPFKNRTKLEYAVFILVGIMILYGIISLSIAIDVLFTFRRLFNLCIDILFFVLLLLYLDSRRKIKVTMFNCLINFIALLSMGIYEAFFGGIFFETPNNFRSFNFFDKGLLFQPKACFGNANDYSSTILFLLPFLIGFLLYLIKNTENKFIKKFYSSILVFITSVSYFIVIVTNARLVLVPIYIVSFGFAFYIIVYQRKLKKILINCILCIAFISIMDNYTDISILIKNHANTKKDISSEIVVADVQSETGTEDIVPEDEKSLTDQIFTIDADTNTVILNKNTSAGLRASLLKFAINTFIDSKGIGVGLGNTELLAKAISEDQFGGIWAIHCFPARIVADMGVFILIPIIIIIAMLLKKMINIILMYNKKKINISLLVLVTVISVLNFVFLATSPSDAQDLLGMWISLAGIILAVIRIPSLYYDNIEVVSKI